MLQRETIKLKELKFQHIILLLWYTFIISVVNRILCEKINEKYMILIHLKRFGLKII